LRQSPLLRLPVPSFPAAATRSSQFAGTGSLFSSGLCPEVPAFSAISDIAVRVFADSFGMFRLSIPETDG
jgi:hypothetical protein